MSHARMACTKRRGYFYIMKGFCKALGAGVIFIVVNCEIHLAFGLQSDHVEKR